MKSSVPHNMTPRNFFAVIGLSLLVLVALVLLSLSQRRSAGPVAVPEAEENSRLIVTQEAIDSIQQAGEQDTDEDGLLDWEEALWGTDPMLADTNDDGVSDHDEVMAIKQELDNNAADEGGTEPAELEPIDTISRDLYSTLAFLDQEGELNEHTEDQVVGLFQETVLQSFQYESVTIAALSLSGDSAKTRVAYFRALDAVLARHMLLESDFVFVANSSQTPIKSEQAVAAVEKYQLLFDELITMSVPVGLQSEHLAVANAAGQLHEALDGLLYADLDPLQGLSAGVVIPVGVGEYHTALVELYAANGQDITAR